MGDDVDTAPIRVPHCSFCRRPYTSHAEDCESARYEVQLIRLWAAREHFNRMSKMDRILALAQGAARRGATFHYKGDWVA